MTQTTAASTTTTTFTVGFRTGGTENFRWQRTVAFATREEAQEVAERTRRMGYHAHVYRTADLDVIGLPDTYEA